MFVYTEGRPLRRIPHDVDADVTHRQMELSALISRNQDAHSQSPLRSSGVERLAFGEFPSL